MMLKKKEEGPYWPRLLKDSKKVSIIVLLRNDSKVCYNGQNSSKYLL